MEAEVQVAVADALLADPGVSALVGDRIYDFTPAGVQAPRITIGDDQSVDDSDGCGTRYEVTTNVHVWSEVPGRAEAKTICDAVRQALKQKLPVPGWRCKVFDYRTTRILNDPDGITTHGIVETRYVFERVA